MKKTDAMKAITKAYTTLYREIEDIHDLNRYHLTLAEFRAAQEIMQELCTPGASAKCFLKNVSAFFQSCGYNVELEETGVNYIISC